MTPKKPQKKPPLSPEEQAAKAAKRAKKVAEARELRNAAYATKGMAYRPQVGKLVAALYFGDEFREPFIDRLVKAKKLESHAPAGGGRVMFKPDDLDALIEEGRGKRSTRGRKSAI